MSKHTPWGQLLGIATALCLALFWQVLTSRVISLPILLCAIVLLFIRPSKWSEKPVLACWALFLLSTLSPVDLSFRETPTPPHFARLLSGLPTIGTIDEAEMGNLVLSGCGRTGLEPKWLFLWRRSGRGIPYSEISTRRLRIIGSAWLLCRQDTKGHLPAIKSMTQLEASLDPYLRGEVLCRDPRTGRDYAFGSVTGTILLYEGQPSADGTRRYLTTDGETHCVSEQEWQSKTL